MKAFRATLAECCSLATEVERVDEVQPGASTAAPMESSDAAAADAAAAQLQAELCLKNEAVKQLIDQLRQMLESMCMWESHKYQLERIRQVEGSA
ncbi:hypothetical protein HYH02_006568 [Chlamydomonas schloesseri]|uniref:Uncharacterized protein n=1 Tax=Chlamydomonas schloesseri TaxID=2026947 RepID=A0A835TJU2_9CHLO|nr:hypothetical protein HYH02_006568 [Chlamydomonas schloesseri]|eukprot:KAG2439040.1 hypothetical protein HYH02_006568 [Chlamydomonas schloesseri]